ncbi:hypothetical protein FGD77_05805 [Roseovarius sp. M141]|nr:hypothetical protein [Roseovarius sp. M141]
MLAAPTGSAILDIYGQGMAAGPADRAALLCAAGGGDADALSIGDVDRTIWGWLTALFDGPQEAVMTCEECGEGVEFALPAGFALPARSELGDGLHVPYGGARYPVRFPRLSDIRGGNLARTALSKDAPWGDPAFEAAAQAALLEADPALQVDLKLECAACGAVQVQPLDVAGFAWARIEQAARRVVQEVAKLARAFGWSEAELTAMTPARRAIWLAELGE